MEIEAEVQTDAACAQKMLQWCGSSAQSDCESEAIMDLHSEQF